MLDREKKEQHGDGTKEREQMSCYCHSFRRSVAGLVLAREAAKLPIIYYIYSRWAVNVERTQAQRGFCGPYVL